MTSIVHIVDDDAAIRDALEFLLQTHGIGSRSWPDAEHFLLDYRENMRGCILLDVRMTGMTGPECFERIAAARLSHAGRFPDRTW